MSVSGGGSTEELKKEAIEKLRRNMEKDYSEGYERAIEMVKDGKISVQEAEKLVNSDPPVHEVLIEQSREFIAGFIDALDEMLRKAREKEEEA